MGSYAAGRSPLTVAAIRRAVGSRGALARPPAALSEHAAVALVFAGADADLSLCFIQRATHPRDPWSGQMALPGGRAARDDDSLRAAAVRETQEEVGLALHRYQYLGAAPAIPLLRHGRPTAATVAPFVFYAGAELPALVPDPREVTAGYWIAVDHLCAPRNHVALERVVAGGTRRLPAIRFGRQLIWGMTYRMVTALLDRAAPRKQGPGHGPRSRFLTVAMARPTIGADGRW